MRLVRFNALSWNINPDKCGVLGFSAGDHLSGSKSKKIPAELHILSEGGHGFGLVI